MLHSSCSFLSGFNPAFIAPAPAPPRRRTRTPADRLHTQTGRHTLNTQRRSSSPFAALESEQTSLPRYSLGPTSQCETSGAHIGCVPCWSTPDPVCFCTGLKSSIIQGRSKVGGVRGRAAVIACCGRPFKGKKERKKKGCVREQGPPALLSGNIPEMQRVHVQTSHFNELSTS